MLVPIKQRVDLIVPMSTEPVRLADALGEHFHKPELPQRPVSGNKVL
jgi:hypothetical protein